MARKNSAASQLRVSKSYGQRPIAKQAKATQAKGATIARKSDGVLNPSLVPPSKRVKVIDEDAAAGKLQKKGEFLPACERVRREN